MLESNPDDVPIPGTAQILERKPARDLTVTLKAGEWANMLRRLRGAKHNPRLFWLCIASIEGQLTCTGDKNGDVSVPIKGNSGDEGRGHG
jgi:hypothetical protein